MRPADRDRMQRLAGGLVTEHRFAQLALAIGVDAIEREPSLLTRAIRAARGLR